MDESMAGEEEKVENMQVIFKGYIDGVAKETDVELKLTKIELKLPTLHSGALLVKNLYLSCDRYMRFRMLRELGGSYIIPPFVPSEVIEGYGVSKVIKSDNPDFKPGDFISVITRWEEYSFISKAEQLRKIQPDHQIPLSLHLGLLGMPGFTAYAGFYEVCCPSKGEYVFVSAASGAAGQLVGQFAKWQGCYVVGSAGSKEKVDFLKNKLRFDEAFNYNEELDLDAALKRCFPQGIDIYFDNVGGDILDAALLNMRMHGRIAVCGMVSQNQGIRNLYNIVRKDIRMQGFLPSAYFHLYPSFLKHVSSYYKQGKIFYLEDMNEGLESAPAALVGLFGCQKVAKPVIRVARE